MNNSKKTKEIKLKLHYMKSKADKENGIYYGGVSSPKHTEELIVDINDDYNFNTETDEFIKNGMFSVEISGTKRALKELGKFLINMAMFETEDHAYHEHIDQLKNSSGEPTANLIVRKISE